MLRLVSTTVATANLLYKLPYAEARTALRTVLDAGPDLVALQEWYVSRLPVLRETGPVDLAPGPRIPGARRAGTSDGFLWVSAIGGGNAVGARADRYRLLEGREAWLSRIGRADRPDRRLGIEPPREATVGVFEDLLEGGTLALISYHLVPKSSRDGVYRADRPLLAGRHRQEVAGIERLAAELRSAGHTVYAAGDANRHLQTFQGLTSAWAGRSPEPTCGRSTYDDVHGPGAAVDVRTLTTASDHRAVFASR